MRVAIADAHVLFRDGLAMALDQVLEQEIKLVECTDLEQLQRCLKISECDLIIVASNSLPDHSKSTFDTLRKIGKHNPIIVSVDHLHELPHFRKSNLDGVISKTAPMSSHIKLMKLLIEQGKSENLLNPFLKKAMPPTDKKLTTRQKQIWSLISLGLSNGEIAEQLNLTEGTIKVHITALFRKLNVKNRTQAMLIGQNGRNKSL